MDNNRKQKQFETAGTMANIHEMVAGVISNLSGNDIVSADHEKLHDDINAAIGRQLRKKEV